VPSSEASSENASAVLQLLRERQPAEFDDAVRLFLERLPQQPNELSRLTRSVLGNLPAPTSTEMAAALTLMRKRRAALGSRRPPFVEYKSYVIQRDPTPAFDESAYDPFLDPATFRLAVAAVDGCAGEKK
jgi:hypothetical protein